MTQKVGQEKEKKQNDQQQSLKGALAGVLTKSPPPATHEPAPPRAREEKPFEVPEEKLRSVLRGDA